MRNVLGQAELYVVGHICSPGVRKKSPLDQTLRSVGCLYGHILTLRWHYISSLFARVHLRSDDNTTNSKMLIGISELASLASKVVKGRILYLSLYYI